MVHKYHSYDHRGSEFHFQELQAKNIWLCVNDVSHESYFLFCLVNKLRFKFLKGVIKQQTQHQNQTGY